jgi:3',5'-cyclic AMP phosphodiesterase CpdA
MGEVTRIAHLSDLHILELQPSFDLNARFVSFGRALDARSRVEKLKAAFRVAKRAGAGHVVVSGDLTETGTDGQFEVLAAALSETAFAPHQVTLTPGNHDAYSCPHAWGRALDGPLRAYRATAARQPGDVVERCGVTLLPIDVSCHQSITRSSGELRADVAEGLERRLRDPAFSKAPIVVVQHHPPFAHRQQWWQWVDGLRGYARLLELLVRHVNTHLLHGHLHQVVDRIVQIGHARVFGAPAIVEDIASRPRVRLYEITGGVLQSAGVITG